MITNIQARRSPRHIELAIPPPMPLVGRQSTTSASRSSFMEPRTFRHVLVILDGTSYAEHALPIALEIARRTGAVLQLAHVNLLLGATFAERSLSFEETIGRHRLQQKRDYLEACDRRLPYGRTEVLWEALRGEHRLRELEAIAGDDTLIVMATPYRGILGCFQFGSAAERLLSIGSSPILFVKGYNWPADVHAPRPIRRILTYLAGATDGEQIMPSASALARAAAASHTLLRVVPNQPYAGIPCEEQHREAIDYLRATAERLGNDPASPVATEVRSSDAPIAQAILTYAQNSEVDVIAIAAHERRGFSKYLKSDPAEYLAQYSRIPVLITRLKRASAP